MKAADSRMMVSRKASGYSVWRVRKLSMKPAMQKRGTVPMTIFRPRLAPRRKE